ncbi:MULTISPECIES: class B sortase [Anaerotruncus]|uniref:Class B sortase n=1 Tax=Anaerotruncus colihominis TaxID=169435 RepID=A0A845SU83_9FIRM|nr:MULTISPECIES: class B sortase [Anaerotruncus]MCI8492179.1 class B sortase [Anaerotruncus sp.]MCR2026987.1 class B sortase [Anaerotruncus colihominis]NBI80274.1 class B sortase [Anaerotruncus colihominis]NDO38000.1 class B sortase [Anaerotruncus colihominis]
MNLLKKVLRGIFYFCVGIKTAFKDFVEWYTTNRAVPRALRNRASLAVIALAVVAGGWGLFAALSNADSIERREPAAAVSQGDVSTPDVPEESESASAEDSSISGIDASVPDNGDIISAPSQDMAVVSTVQTTQVAAASTSESDTSVDALAGATRFTPVTADQLSRLIKSRAKDYQENPVNTPPSAGDINAWKAVNSDVFGWITVPNTNISYPLVYHTNTNYYTSLGYYKEPSRNGVIWADADTRFDSSGEVTSRNLVLYGHNWTNCWRPVRIGNPADVMFAQLAAYDDATFAKENQYIRIATTGGDHLYQVFTVFYTDLSFGYNYADGAVVNQIISTAKAKSIHDFGVSVGATDQIVTLSTCTRVLGPGDNQRFVVMAKKVS